ncbi:MAG: hypothetical protein AABZ08_01755 [Planctomycetota bacterium]
MTHSDDSTPIPSPGSAPELPTIIWRVERSHALMRSMWRLLAMVVCAAVLFIVRLDWHLLWLTDKASFLGLGLLLLTPLAASLALAISAVRWLLLAARPGVSHITISPQDVTIDLGPFGKRSHPWTDLLLNVDTDLDRELLESLPDDAFVPRLTCKSTGEDVIKTALRFTSVSNEAVTRALREYLRLEMK